MHAIYTYVSRQTRLKVRQTCVYALGRVHVCKPKLTFPSYAGKNHKAYTDIFAKRVLRVFSCVCACVVPGAFAVICVPVHEPETAESRTHTHIHTAYVIRPEPRHSRAFMRRRRALAAQLYQPQTIGLALRRLPSGTAMGACVGRPRRRRPPKSQRKNK